MTDDARSMAQPAPDGAPPPAMGAREVLRIPAFRRLWLAQLISDAGDGLTNLTLLLLVNHLTGSTAALAAMAIALAVPPLTIGLVAGTLADRVDRRRLMLASDLLRAVIVLHHYLDQPMPVVAATLGIPLGTAKSRLHRALDEMRAALDADARVRGDLVEGRPA